MQFVLTPGFVQVMRHGRAERPRDGVIDKVLHSRRSRCRQRIAKQCGLVGMDVRGNEVHASAPGERLAQSASGFQFYLEVPVDTRLSHQPPNCHARRQCGDDGLTGLTRGADHRDVGAASNSVLHESFPS